LTSSSTLLPKGLFGGLLSELKVNEEGLRSHIEKAWSCKGVALVNDLEEWRRGGAETYIARSSLDLVGGSSLEVVGKAFVGMGLSPVAQQDRWIKRRDLLQRHGVNVPFLYATYPGMIVEECIPIEFEGCDAAPDEIAFQLGQISSVMFMLRFHPVALAGDVRVKDGRVFMIDFGSDLGDPDTSMDESWLENLREKFTGRNRSAFEHGLITGYKTQ
jgi:hypothetical protein